VLLSIVLQQILTTNGMTAPELLNLSLSNFRIRRKQQYLVTCLGEVLLNQIIAMVRI
jgi:hypothetical protein